MRSRHAQQKIVEGQILVALEATVKKPWEKEK